MGPRWLIYPILSYPIRAYPALPALGFISKKLHSGGVSITNGDTSDCLSLNKDIDLSNHGFQYVLVRTVTFKYLIMTAHIRAARRTRSYGATGAVYGYGYRTVNGLRCQKFGRIPTVMYGLVIYI
jgi:hypothetical protein